MDENLDECGGVYIAYGFGGIVGIYDTAVDAVAAFGEMDDTRIKFAPFGKVILW